MTVVGIICPACPNMTDIQLEEMILDVAGLGEDPHIGGILVWVCTDCESLVHREVPWRDVVGLVGAGVALLDEPLDDRLAWYPESALPGPLLAYDDLLELQRLLQTANWFADLQAAICPPDEPLLTDAPYKRGARGHDDA